MPLYYVTGVSGTGKSSVLRELRTRGYHARGVDEDGYADWINRISGRTDAFPRGEQDFDRLHELRNYLHLSQRRHGDGTYALRFDDLRSDVFASGVQEPHVQELHDL